MEHNQIINATNRKVTDTYTLPNGYRVKVVTSHNKDYKSYRSLISECVTTSDNGYTWERHVIWADLMQLIATVPAVRYNYERLKESHQKALALAGDLVNELLNKNKDREMVSA